MTKKKLEFSWWPEWPYEDEDDREEWPEEAPYPLNAENIQHRFLGSGDCRCLLGWSGGFPEAPRPSKGPRHEVDAELRRVIAKRLGIKKLKEIEAIEIDVYSDCHDPEEVAEVWNETIRNIGYTEATCS